MPRRASLAEVTESKNETAGRLEAEAARSRRLAREFEEVQTESSSLRQRVARLEALQDTFEQVRRVGSALGAALGEHQVCCFLLWTNDMPESKALLICGMKWVSHT
jgi:chromosome segregation ATPase